MKKIGSRLIAVCLMLTLLFSNAKPIYASAGVLDYLKKWGINQEKISKELQRKLDVLQKDSEEKIQEYLELISSVELSKVNAGIFDYVDEKAKRATSKLVTENRLFDELEWNYKMIYAEDGSDDEVKGEKIKVAIIDSGINVSSDIDVEERKNFIPGEDEVSPLYEDFSGHGTNIAGIIAAKENEIGITGINPNVELYSARVLDGDNTAPVSRVVEAIEWAIEKNIDIINLSFTTNEDSKELRDVVRKAYSEGVLMVAAAGNGEKVAFPAAYPEVIAVGSINSKGEVSTFSPLNGVELVAPGELITSVDIFDTLSTHSGTSYAAPHVTAIASKLWERDRTVSGDYVRSVLDISANMYAPNGEIGYGLVDYEFACMVFDALRPFADICDSFGMLMQYAITVCDLVNTKGVIVTENGNEGMVEGAWYLDNESKYAHRTIFDGMTTKSTNGRALILAGCCISDYEVPGYKKALKGPFYHGGTFDQNNGNAETNYLASAIYLTMVAKDMVRGIEDKGVNQSPLLVSGSLNLSGNTDFKYVDESCGLTWNNSAFVNQLNKYPFSKATSSSDVNAKFNYNDTIHRGLVLYGIALHHIADVFSHSSVGWLKKDATGKWCLQEGTGSAQAIIRHTTIYVPDSRGNYTKAISNAADSMQIIEERYLAAKEVCRNALKQISNMSNNSNTSSSAYSRYQAIDLSIFDIDYTGYESEVQLAYFADYASQVCASSLFDAQWDDYYYELNPKSFKDLNRNKVLTSRVE